MLSDHEHLPRNFRKIETVRDSDYIDSSGGYFVHMFELWLDKQ